VVASDCSLFRHCALAPLLHHHLRASRHHASAIVPLCRQGSGAVTSGRRQVAREQGSDRSRVSLRQRWVKHELFSVCLVVANVLVAAKGAPHLRRRPRARLKIEQGLEHLETVSIISSNILRPIFGYGYSVRELNYLQDQVDAHVKRSCTPAREN
jgi:hypothetical protein